MSRAPSRDASKITEALLTTAGVFNVRTIHREPEVSPETFANRKLAEEHTGKYSLRVSGETSGCR